MSVRRVIRGVLAGFVLVVVPVLAFGQTPDHRGEVTVDQPTYRGIKASAPIPPELHVRNEGGSDGAGLCVISSLLANGRYQKVPGLGSYAPTTLGQGGKDSRLWRLAKSRPGGYSPDKAKALAAEALPGELYASLVGTGTAEDFEMIEQLSKAGYPIGMTMNTAALYGYRPIHHMVSWPQFRRSGYSCFVDNNKPGVFSWIPSAEAMRRAVDMGMVWAWVWTRKPAEAAGSLLLIVILAGAAFVLAQTEDEPDEAECEACLP